MKRSHRYADERGAQMVEYSMAAALLVPLFVIAAILIRQALSTKAESSAGAVKNTVPVSTAIVGLAESNPAVLDESLK